jgi:hypothetical protein
MSETTTPGAGDPSTQPDYEQLGEAGNPFSRGTDADAENTADSSGTPAAGGEPAAGIDNAPGDQGYEDDPDQNPPLPDWGPTDGTHGVDGADPDA